MSLSEENAASVMRSQTVRLYPTAAQAERLSQWAGTVRFVYNLALEQRKTFWRPGRHFNYATQSREITELRATVEWIADVPRSPLSYALSDLDQAYANWWAGRAGAPSYRTRRENDSFRLQGRDCSLRRTSRRSGQLRIPKLGDIRFRWTGATPATWVNCTIYRRGGAWFAAGPRTVEARAPACSPQMVGVDRGIRAFAALSSGELVVGPNPGRRAAKTLARAQRNLSRKQKGSRNRDKQRRRVAKLHMRLADARKDFLHRISTAIAQNHGTVVLEDLKVKNMTRRAVGKGRAAKSGLNRSILDQGWGTFRQMLAYKLAERGARLILVAANDTSRTCAACGVVDGDSRKAERFKCTVCGHEADADTNAAINILRRGRASVLPVEASACEPAHEAGTSRTASRLFVSSETSGCGASIGKVAFPGGVSR
jgi:putative transposase